MKTYKISVLVEDEYLLEVEANNENEAIEIAEEQQADGNGVWVNGTIESQVIEKKEQ